MYNFFLVLKLEIVKTEELHMKIIFTYKLFRATKYIHMLIFIGAISYVIFIPSQSMDITDVFLAARISI